MQTIVEDNLREAERRIEEARRTQAESLYLGDLALRELPASLGDLPHLKRLLFGRHRLTEAGELEWVGGREAPAFTDLAPLAGLQALQSLDLDGCVGVTDIAPLTQLQTLQSLDLSSCEKISDLAPLARLQTLQSLDLSFCTGFADLAPLAQIQVLKNLYLIGCIGVTDIAPLAQMQALQNLKLTYCTGVTDVAPLAQIQTLRNLELINCTGVIDVASLAQLPALQSLDLSGTNVTDIAPLAKIQTLKILHLFLCSGITDIAPLAQLQGLQSLGLTNSSVTDIAPLAQMQSLKNLDFYGCRPAIPAKIIRAFADHPRLAKLVADEAAGVPGEVLSHDYGDNCLPRLRAYFAELALGAEAENEVKVILLGNSRVGKTQLCRRFRREPFDETVTSTHGVQIWREELRIRTGSQEQVFQVNWWDFGGQDIYHGTHALFLRSRAVFLILWTPQLENQDEYLENGIPLRNQPLAYWLDYVRSLAGEDSPVIVVQSQCDRITDRRPPPARLDGPGFFEVSYSAKEDQGRDTLEAHLHDAMRYLLDRHGALEIGNGRAEVRRRLYDWRSKDQNYKPEKRCHRTVTLDEFRTLCDEVGGIVSWEHALDFFHHTGVVFYEPDLFASCIILDQDWALDAVYTVFHRGRAAPWLRDSGRFTRADLAWMAWQEHSSEEQRLFLGLMESCGVCFRCGKTAQGEPCYIASDLLPGFEVVKGRLHAWREEPGMPILRLEYRFFHQAVIRGLMSRIGYRAGDLAEYWKYGFWLKDGQRDTQILVQFENTSTVQAPGAGALVLKALGQDALGLLREIRRSILCQRIGEEPEELLTLEGITVARSALAAGFDGRVLDLQRKPVPAASFAAFFENWEHDLEDLAKMDIRPQPLTENEKPREVFISYAWGDDTDAGKVRAQVVDELQTTLEKDGFVPIRDRDQMRPGDRISAFMRQLTRADYVVAVISDKYLRSPYCMYEIYKLWQRWQGDADSMARSVVPIVLPEVKVGSFQQRAPYLKHWSDQAKSLEALVRDPDLRPGSQSWEEVRLVREFAHHVDDILVFLNDVLMPRQLEAHLDHGFPAVREALQRRISEK